MNKVNRTRRQIDHAKGYGEPHPATGKNRGHAVRAMPCIVAEAMAKRQNWSPEDSARMRGCSHVIEACHARARGMGGAKGDQHDLFPGCSTHHTEAGEMPGPGRWEGTARAVFEETYGVDCTAKAAEISVQLTAEGYP